MEITGGRIESFNRKLDSRWIISGLNQKLTLRTDRAANTASLEGESDIREFSYGTGSSWYVENLPLRATERLSYLPGGDRLEISELSILLKDVPLRLTGTVDGVSLETNTLDLSVESPDLTVEQLVSLLPAGAMKNSQGVSASGAASFSMKVSGRSNDTLNPAVSGSFTVSNGTIRYGTLPRSITGVTVDGTLDIPESRVGNDGAGSMELKKFSATLGANTLSGRLGVSGFGDPKVTASLRGKAALGEIGEYYPLAEGTKLSGTASCDLSIDGKALDPKGLRASGGMTFTDVSYSSPEMARPLRRLNGEVTFDNQRLIMKNLTMVLGGSDMKLDATVRNYLALMAETPAAGAAKPSLEFTLKSKTLDMADLTGDEREGGGAAGGGAQGSGGTPLLPGIDLTGTVDVETLRTEKFTFTNARGDVSMEGGIAKLKEMRLGAFGGTIQTSGSLDLRDPSRRPFDLKLDVRDVESNSMLSPFTTFGQYLFGKLDLSTSMKGDLDDTLGINRTTLTGAGTALVSNGRLTGVPVLQKISTALSAAKLKEVDFRNWTQSFSVADGKLKIRDLKIGGSDASIVVNGVHGLDGSIDYSMNVVIPKAAAEKITPRGVPDELLEFFRDKEGNMSFDFLAGGQSSSPDVKLDTRAQENLLKQRLTEGAAKQLTDPLKKAAEGLKNLLKPKPAAPDSGR